MKKVKLKRKFITLSLHSLLSIPQSFSTDLSMTGSRKIKLKSFTIIGILKTSIFDRIPKIQSNKFKMKHSVRVKIHKIFFLHLLQTGKKMALRHWNSSSTLISNLYLSLCDYSQREKFHYTRALKRVLAFRILASFGRYASAFAT